MNLVDIKEKLNFIDKIPNLQRRLKKNSLISYYYDMMAEDLYFEDLPDVVLNSPYFKEDFWMRRREDLHERAKRVSLCSTFFSGSYFPLQGVKDIERINLCHDRFCDNCQNTMAVQRSDKYTPVLLKLSQDYDIYHVVLTVPNVPLSSLVHAVDKIFKSYKRLCIFLSGRKFVTSIDYLSFGYLGSIRALEITKNKETNLFHPHLHCIFVCRKGSKLASKRVHVNRYSFKKYNSHIPRGNIASNDPQRFFNDFEILLQKTWRLLYDGVELNKKNLDSLPLGYSCMIDSAKGRYKEVFKYATKGLLSSDPDKDPMDSYSDFVLLFMTLYRRRLIQGYGSLYRLKFDEEVSLSSDELYEQVIEYLKILDPDPIPFIEDREQLAAQMIHGLDITYISRKSVSQLGAKDE